MNGSPLCTYEEIESYLKEIDEVHLLQYVERKNDAFILNKENYDKQKTPSIRMQIACVFTVLGEYDTAEEIHEIRWRDLSDWGDKVVNGILKKYMHAWPK